MAGTRDSSVRSYNFYAGSSLQGGGTYAENQFDFVDLDDGTPFVSHSILIANDSGNNISFRFTADPGSGPAHGLVESNERIELNFKRARRIYLSGTAGSQFRLWAW